MLVKAAFVRKENSRNKPYKYLIVSANYLNE